MTGQIQSIQKVQNCHSHILYLKNPFGFNRTFINLVLVIMRKENVNQCWTQRETNSSTIHLNVKLLVKCKQSDSVAKFSKLPKPSLYVPVTKNSGFRKSFFIQISIAPPKGMLVSKKSN